MSVLPVDNLWPILLNFSAKSLLRFKSVCKLWNIVINDPIFISVHCDFSNKFNRNNIILRTPKLYMLPYDDGSPTQLFSCIELDYPFNDFPVYVDESCRGLICFTVDIFPNDIYLYNPTTRTHKTLPVLVPKPEPEGHCYIGFGYDSRTSDYKCVKIFQWLVPFNSEVVQVKSRVMVYSLRCDGWIRVDRGVPDDLKPYHKHGVHLDGILHWWGEESDGSVLPIISYNLRNDSFSSMPIPDTYHDYRFTCSHLGVIEGCLCLTVNFTYECDVWIMKVYGRETSWTKLFTVRKPFINQELKPICFLSQKILLVNFPRFDVSFWNIETKGYRKHRISDFYKIENAFVCTENLLMLTNNAINDVPLWRKRQRTKRL